MASSKTPSLTDPETGPTLLADRAYGELRDRLVRLQIKPGEPIDEDDLGTELKMGRTPSPGSGGKRLRYEQLVTIYPRRGTFASDINITDLAQISDLRAVVESHAARRAAERLTAARREELLQLDAELEAAPSDQEGLMELDVRVHRFVYRCADNPYLAATCSSCFNLSMRIWHLAIDRLPALSDRVQEHRILLAAIADGDGERAAAILGEHVRVFERSVRAVL